MENINKNKVKESMKRYGNIYQSICDLENLKLAHKFARKDKAYYRAVKLVDSDPDFYLGQIQEMLTNKTYQVSEYTTSTINDKGKVRELMKLPYFPDRIIQWAILLKIEQIFVSGFCSFTCASLSGRGIKRAAELTIKYLKDLPNTEFCLKLDIRKYYPNINHSILKAMLRKKFKDADLLELLDKIIDSYPGEKGVPIGSYLSQFFANFYLSHFDHWLKEVKGVKYVVRYMDDIIIFNGSKSALHTLRREIDEYANNKKESYMRDGLPKLETDQINLKNGEILHFCKVADLCKNKTATVGYSGVSQGVNVHVMKGLNFRVGNYRGSAIKHNYLERNEGTIFLTNKRIIFSGGENIWVAKFSDILILDVKDDLIKIQTSERSMLFDFDGKVDFLIILDILINKKEEAEQA